MNTGLLVMTTYLEMPLTKAFKRTINFTKCFIFVKYLDVTVLLEPEIRMYKG